jgi:hypothetical protein
MLAVRPTDGRRNNERLAAHLVSRAGPGAELDHCYVEQSKKAKAFFGTLSKANVYPIVYRLQAAKKQKPGNEHEQSSSRCHGRQSRYWF